jgi:hypothetical protein
MKQILCVLAFCMTIVVACIKEQTTPKPLSSQIESRVTFMDDFYLSKIVKPLFHRIDTATIVTLFSDSVYNNFGGSLKRISFQFSNPNIIYKNFKLTVTSTTGGQRKGYGAATTSFQNGIKELTFDNISTGILLSPGWSTIVLRGQVFGNPRDSFHVTIPQGGIIYHSINDLPGAVVGLPLSTKGLRIR